MKYPIISIKNEQKKRKIYYTILEIERKDNERGTKAKKERAEG